MDGIASSTPTTLLSVELCVLSFCFHEKLIAIPLPKLTMAPDCPLQSSCTAYEASTHHFGSVIVSADNTNGICIVPLRYCSTRFSFPQSSSSGDFTLVVRKAVGVWISHRARPCTNTSLAVVRWKLAACSSGNFFASPSPRILNR